MSDIEFIATYVGQPVEVIERENQQLSLTEILAHYANEKVKA